ncbi:cytidylate kinase family protein [Proteiniclasticum ruminis]|uniref:Cytidylate kinase n=1 Tax=Proteiniclasticum ruminis TaxID=398199 RepID=A0A1I4YQM9_9CLOT|nr:cytidylate kinase family protein [Proteiniclasticum ruminis]SFN40312.1 Cytidylate kinase [Proteiniclasticum ruminis]
MKSLLTFSRETGSMGDQIAKGLAHDLDISYFNREYALRNWLPEIATKHELHMLEESPGYFLKSSASGITFQEFIERKLNSAVSETPAIISGLGAQIIFRKHTSAGHIKIHGSIARRTQRLMKEHNLIEDDAKRILELTDRRHKKYIHLLYHEDWSNSLLYDLILNTDNITLEESLSILKNYYHLDQPAPESLKNGTVIFKNTSEEEFAKVLDLYDFEWDYEPRTFPLEWDIEGNITKAFSPDFYLPKFDTYIELTVMNQKYTQDKKKKLSLMKKLYPKINVSIVYKNDFHNLLERFAKWEAIDE